MRGRNIIEMARANAGLSQAALARKAGTSRPTLSAYERGHKSPTLDTTTRIVGAAGFDLALAPRLEFHSAGTERGRPIQVPTALPRLPTARALITVELPLHLNWSDPGRRYDLSDRRQRARVYEIVLREGGPVDVLSYIDGALLLDLWDDLVLPRTIRDAWQPLVDGARTERVPR
jgi:transcriptional regulator with XRE-family HTH domain